MDIVSLWKKTLQLIKGEVASASFETFFKNTVPIETDSNELTLLAPNEFAEDILRTRYLNLIESCLSQLTSNKFEIKIISDSNEVEQNPLKTSNNNHNINNNSNNNIIRNYPRLNPKYTFDTFVIGNSNRFAHAACVAVAESPAKAYNPLFLYGGVGLGKTHLMQAIGNKIKANNPNAKIIYVSSENFMNEFITSIREKTGDKFRSKYRAADALLVDDVQFLKNKEATQDEFFHTFNELFNSKKQIVLTSDRLPNELKTLEDRLRTRFGQGLTIDVSVPNFETRVAILQQKALEHNKEIDEDALLYVAEHIRSSVRELEGALLKIISMSEFKKCKITKDFAEEVLKKLIPKSETVTPQNIIKKVSTFYNISESDITGKVKTKEIVVPRQISMYLCRKILNMNDTNIGKEFGKDRTTVGHNIEKIEESIDTNSTIKSDVNYILKDLNYNEG